jgi:hypothetical protein
MQYTQNLNSLWSNKLKKKKEKKKKEKRNENLIY